MPYCRQCHREISKFDNDMCPYCGTPHPIDPNYETMDITRNMATLEGQYELPKSRKKKVLILLCATLGYLGVHWFYIYRKTRGIVSLLFSLAFVGGIGSLLLLTPLPVYADYLIAFGAVWIVFLIEALLLLFIDTPKDGRGEFLR